MDDLCLDCSTHTSIMKLLDPCLHPHSRARPGQAPHRAGHQRSPGHHRAGPPQPGPHPHPHRPRRPATAHPRSRSRHDPARQPHQYARHRGPAVGLGPRVRRIAGKTHPPARQTLGRTPHLRGGRPRPALERHQHRKARRRRGPPLRRYTLTELPGFPMSVLRRLGFLVLAALAAGGFAVYRVEQPYQDFRGETFVEFPHGTGTGDIADTLAKAGVVRSRWDFLLARVASRTRVLQAGEYRFDRAASPMEVVRRIARGDIFYYELVVPEGRNLFDIAAAVEQLGLFPAPKFLEAARDPALIRDLDPQAPTLEGYLFPDTYKLSRHTTPDRLCRLMTGKFRDAW